MPRLVVSLALRHLDTQVFSLERPFQSQFLVSLGILPETAAVVFFAPFGIPRRFFDVGLVPGQATKPKRFVVGVSSVRESGYRGPRDEKISGPAGQGFVFQSCNPDQERLGHFAAQCGNGFGAVHGRI